MEVARANQKQYFFWLLIPYSLFIFRVIAQFIQKNWAFDFLPPFEKWYSGALSYPWLLLSQLIIIIALTVVLIKFYRQKVKKNRKRGVILNIIGFLYLMIMTGRLMAGLTFAQHHPWFGATIPAFFHIVLASFILLVGNFHTNVKEVSQWVSIK